MRCPRDPQARPLPGTLKVREQTARALIHINPTQPDHYTPLVRCTARVPGCVFKSEGMVVNSRTPLLFPHRKVGFGPA